MREGSTVRRLDPAEGAWQKCLDVTRKALGAGLIVHLAVARESRQAIGYVPQTRGELSYRGQGKLRPRTGGNQCQRQPDEHKENDPSPHPANYPLWQPL